MILFGNHDEHLRSRHLDGRDADVSVAGVLSVVHGLSGTDRRLPRLAPYDLLLWQAQIEALMRDRD